MAKKRIAFIVVALLILSIFPGLALGASVSLNLSNSSALIGDSITASGSADPNQWVSIKIVDSLGNIVFFDAVKSNASGNYSYTFKVPQVADGTLTVVAGYGSNVANKSLQVSIYKVLDPKTCDPDKKWKVVFNKPANPNTLKDQIKVMKTTDNSQVGIQKVAVENNGFWAVIYPAQDYQSGQTYVIYINPDIATTDGEPLKSGYQMSFTVN